MLNRRAAQLVDLFRQRGFDSVILKGQGLAQLYDSPELLCPGDIDIWGGGSESWILTCVSQLYSFAAPVYHNVACRIFDDVVVEVHFRPSWMNNYFIDRRLQCYFTAQFPVQKSHRVPIENSSLELPTSTVAFNRIFVLIHIYRHLFGEGIGLRQLLDYYYVLKQGTSEEEREQTMRILAELDMTRFARGIMYVLQHVFGLESRYLLCEPCSTDGKMLLSEIMIAGNFGHYDLRINTKKKSELAQFVARCRRNFRFVHYYPDEVMWAPLFKVWHFIWRTRYKRANNSYR